MSKRKLRKLFVPSIYVMAIFVFCMCLYLVQRLFNNDTFVDENMQYVDSEIVTENIYIPVVNEVSVIMRPYLNDSVYISKSFYNYLDESSNQENSIVFFEGTYMQNSGVDYKFKEKFDVISILDGTVVEVSENAILGKTIKIKHDNDIISIYQCLDGVNINENDIVLRGQVIGNSGTSTLYNSEFNLHFELYVDGKNVNPEEYYNRSIDEF